MIMYRTIEKISIIFGLLILSEAFKHVIGPWNVVRTISLASIIGLFLLNYKQTVITILRSPHIIILIAFAMLSILWTASPASTLSRNFALLFTVLLAAIFVTRFSFEEQFKILAIVSAIWIVLSFVFVFAVPTYGLQGSLWRGIFAQKNNFGRNMAIVALVALTYPASNWKAYSIRITGYGLALFSVLMANSMASLITIISITILSIAYKIIQMRPLLSIALLFAITVPAVLFFYVALTVDTDTILVSLGRNPSLTGRTEVWENVRFAISERPILGYGYGGFWQRSDVYDSLWSVNSNWRPGSAHNTYLDIWVQIGVLGVAIYLIGFVLISIQAIWFARANRTSNGLWPLLFLSFLSIMGFSEDFILINNIAWMLYLAIAFHLGNSMRLPEGRRNGYQQIILPLSGANLLQQPQLSNTQ
jgi:O-antigen ligase